MVETVQKFEEVYTDVQNDAWWDTIRMFFYNIFWNKKH